MVRRSWIAEPLTAVGQVAINRSVFEPAPLALYPFLRFAEGESLASRAPDFAFMEATLSAPEAEIPVALVHDALLPFPSRSDQPAGGVVPVSPMVLKFSVTAGPLKLI